MRIGAGAIIATVLAIAVLSTVSIAALTSQVTHSVRTSVEDNLATPIERLELLSRIRDDLGYGGAIHEFKNFVLRGNAERLPVIRAEYADALAAIDAFRLLSESEQEDRALDNLAVTLRHYERNLELAARLHAQGLSVTEIDQRVRTNDNAAVDAVHQLEDSVRDSMVNADAHTQTAVDNLSFGGLIIGLLAIFNLATLALVIVLSNRQSKALERSNESLERASEAKTRFLANMSHELRTPMTGVIGLVNMLRSTRLDKEQSKLVDTLDCSGTSMIQIINDILDVTKIESGKLEIDPAPTSPAKLCRKVEALYSSAALAKRLELKVEIDPALAGNFWIDEMRLNQVIGNLVSNAIKFTASGHVKLVASLANDELHFAVQDTGIGVDEDARARIFDRFSQADTSTTRKFGGTGLGLTISREIAELMHGRLTLTSQLGIGTEFALHIPARSAPSLGETTDEAQDIQIASRLRVLIVDDVATNRLVLSSMLAIHDCSITEHDNGASALDAVQTETFDLVLSDIHMPELDGTELVAAIRKWETTQGRARMPVYAITADAFREQHDTYLAAGMGGVISKPFKANEIEATLARVSERIAPPENAKNARAA